MAYDLGVTVNAGEKCKVGDRNLSTIKPILRLFGNLSKRKRIVKKKRYTSNRNREEYVRWINQQGVNR